MNDDFVETFKNLKPEKITLSGDAYDKVIEITERADNTPTPALVELMRRKRRWEEEKS